MGQLILATAPSEGGGLGPVVLDDERVRDQLSAAEELLYVGHLAPAILAAAVALEGAMRLCATTTAAGPDASWGALLEALLASNRIDGGEDDLLYRALSSRDRLAHGYMPEPEHALSRRDVIAVVEVTVRLLEIFDIGPLADAPEPRSDLV